MAKGSPLQRFSESKHQRRYMQYSKLPQPYRLPTALARKNQGNLLRSGLSKGVKSPASVFNRVHLTMISNGEWNVGTQRYSTQALDRNCLSYVPGYPTPTANRLEVVTYSHPTDTMPYEGECARERVDNPEADQQLSDLRRCVKQLTARRREKETGESPPTPPT